MTQIHPSRFSTVRAVTGLALLVWLVAAIVGATTGLVNRSGQPPVILLSFIVVPIALGVVAYRLSPSLRAWTDRFSLTWMVGLHTWRFVDAGQCWSRVHRGTPESPSGRAPFPAAAASS